jgi:hypothetical protein
MVTHRLPTDFNIKFGLNLYLGIRAEIYGKLNITFKLQWENISFWLQQKLYLLLANPFKERKHIIVVINSN